MENLKTISRPYATACFNYCLETDNVENQLNFWTLVLKSMTEALQSQPGQEALLVYQNYQPSVTKFIEEVLPKELLTPEVKNFLAVVEENKRYEYVPAIYDFFVNLRTQYDLPTPVTVVSARQLTNEEKTKIGKRVASKFNKKIALNVVVDPSLLSGIVIKTDDFIIDCSGRKTLENLRASLNK